MTDYRYLIGRRVRPVTVEMTECPACEGYGGFQHPLWGSPRCPEPSIECDFCDGVGEVPVDTAREWSGHMSDDDIAETIACDRYHALKDEGKI